MLLVTGYITLYNPRSRSTNEGLSQHGLGNFVHRSGEFLRPLFFGAIYVIHSLDGDIGGFWGVLAERPVQLFATASADTGSEKTSNVSV